eukprot:TRINITY_DN7559_c0_g2_i6.p2 TRINITY_DN7559_c0_g2~~TRINITY_DN7559_c0_g2_i6.p2  ORF type:complete len:122 (-),score=10.64 TRINITY_DN7559_c0_g2_i6:352-717(-)
MFFSVHLLQVSHFLPLFQVPRIFFLHCGILQTIHIGVFTTSHLSCPHICMDDERFSLGTFYPLLGCLEKNCIFRMRIDPQPSIEVGQLFSNSVTQVEVINPKEYLPAINLPIFFEPGSTLR